MKRLGALCLVLILAMSAFAVMPGFTAGTEETELLEDHEELGVNEIEPEDEAVGVELDAGQVTLRVNVSDGIGNNTNVVFYNATDDIEIGEDLDVEDEGWAEAAWEDLEYGTTYEWYVNISDANNEDNYSVEGPWSFTTEHIPNMPELVRPDDEATGVSLNPELNVSVSHPEGEQMNVTFYNATDDYEIGNVTEVDSGEEANMTWENLEYGTTYEWYVNVTEVGNETENYTVSDTWTFTTESIEFTDVYPESGSEDVEIKGMNTTLKVNVTHPEGNQMNVTFYNATDDEIGNVTEVDSGEEANVTWEDLEYGTLYEWYVVAEEVDNDLTETSETWNFTTEEEPDMYNLNLSIEGSGSVTVEWGEEEETVTDDEILEFRENTTVTLISDADENWHFVEWTGNVSSTDEQITIDMDNDKEITARFEESDQPYFEVEIIEYDEEIEVGRYVMVKFIVENTGEVKGTQDIIFSVEGSQEDVKEFTLDVGENHTGKFFWEAEMGSHLLTVESEDDEDTVAVHVQSEEDLMPGFTSILLILATVFAVVVYNKKKKR